MPYSTEESDFSTVQLTLPEGASRRCNYAIRSRCGQRCSTIRVWCRTPGWHRPSVLASRAGLRDLSDRFLTVPGGAGHAAGAKVTAVVAGMVAGADSIADLGVLRHGGMSRLFTGVRAPSTLGTFLRAFRFGHVRQLDAVAARFMAGLARHSPLIGVGEPVTYVDIDDTVRGTFGYTKQGSGFGYSGVKGLNALLATVSTSSSAPVIVATRLPKGTATPRVAPRGSSPTRCAPPPRAGWSGPWCHRRRPTAAGPVLHHRPQGPGRSSRPSPASPTTGGRPQAVHPGLARRGRRPSRPQGVLPYRQPI
jgi:hypothetical protein